jgi:hypothetical protein
MAAIGLPLAAIACNALNGAADLDVAAPCVGCEVADAPTSDQRAVVVPEAGAADASVDAPPDVFVRPSFCAGIVMYARFDGTLVTAQGLAPDAPPVHSFVPGRFGDGVLLNGTNTALYYVEGVPPLGVHYPKDEGSAAMWLKPTWAWPTAVDRVVWKPVADRTVNTAAAGPSIRSRGVPPLFFGSSNSEPGSSGINEDVGGTAAELAPYWKTDWNHLAETWSRSSPTITFTLNGAEGDPTITRRETDAGWTAQSPLVQYIRFSSNSVPADAAYDDFALWDRSLSLAEIQAMYGANKSLGELCGL